MSCFMFVLRLSPPDIVPVTAAGGRTGRPGAEPRRRRGVAPRARPERRDRTRTAHRATAVATTAVHPRSWCPPHHARRTASSRTAVRPVAYCGLFFPPDHTGQATTESRLTSYVTVTTTIPAAAPPVAASSASRPREGKRPAAAARPRPPPTGSRSPLVRCAVL